MSNASSVSRIKLIIFLTVFLDLIGFSIIFPLYPAMLRYYLDASHADSVLHQIVQFLTAYVPEGADPIHLVGVLFGGFLGAVYSALQFFAAPLWGSLSDRWGRRRILKITTIGICLGYAVWALSDAFWGLLLSRVLTGLMAGNISVAMAAMADMTGRDKRTSGMALIGVAFGLGFVFGPALGGGASMLDLSSLSKGSVSVWGLHPFSAPALAALGMALLNVVFVYASFPETLNSDSRLNDVRWHPLAVLKSVPEGILLRVVWIQFLVILVFSGMEFTLTFLAFERLAYDPADNVKIFLFIGSILLLTQGWIVRKYGKYMGERRASFLGVLFVGIGLFALSMAFHSPLFYVGLAFLALGMGLFNPSFSSYLSMRSADSVQGASLGAFRSAGALGRVFGPLWAAFLYWSFGSMVAYFIGSLILIYPFVKIRHLPTD